MQGCAGAHAVGMTVPNKTKVLCSPDRRAKRESKRMNQILVSIMVAAVLGFGVLAHATGNGAPSDTHYNLNILGKDNCAGDDLTGSQRHTIQVLLQFQNNPNGTLATQLDKRNK